MALDLGSNDVVSAAIGSLIGGGFAVLGVYLTHMSQEKAKKHADRQAARNLLVAIREELRALLEIYEGSVRKALLATEDDAPMLTTWPVSQDRFSVYEASCASLGLVEDDELRSKIVRVYVLAGGLLATYRFNNILIERYEHYDFLSRSDNSQVAAHQAQGVLEQLVAYAPRIKERDKKLVADGTDLIDSIELHISKGLGVAP